MRPADLEEKLNDILSYEIVEWSRDRFRILTQISLALKAIEGLEFNLFPGSLQIHNECLYSEEFKSVFDKFREIVQTTNSSSPKDFLRLGKNSENISNSNFSLQEILEKITDDIISCRTDELNIIYVHRDRGANLDYYQKNNYDIAKLISIKQERSYWSIDSFYKNWILYEVTTCSFYELDKIIEICDVDFYDLVPRLRESYLECYGCIYSLFVVIEQHKLKTIELSNIYEIIEKLYLCYSIYIRYHHNKDVLKDSEIYANMGRLSRLCFSELVCILVASNISNVIPEYLYIYFFLKAMKTTPAITGRKYDYHASALMMYSNQNVRFVTKDPFDIPWNEVENAAYQYVSNICRYVEDKYLIIPYVSSQNLKKKFYKKEVTLKIKSSVKISPFVAKDVYRERESQEYIRFLDVFHQFEPYNKYGYVKNVFKPIYFSINDLIKNIGENYIIEIKSFKTPKGRHVTIVCDKVPYGGQGIIDTVYIEIIHVSIDDNDNIEYMMLYLYGDPKDVYAMYGKLKKERIIFKIPFFPIRLIDVNFLPSKIKLKPLFRNSGDFGFNMLK